MMMNSRGTTNTSAASADALAKQQLAAEIARIDAELERKKLEDEIRAMEAAIQQQQQAQKGPSQGQHAPPQRSSSSLSQSSQHSVGSTTSSVGPTGQRRMVKKKRLVRKNSGAGVPPVSTTVPPTATSSSAQDAQVARLQLEEEIRQMEAAIAAQQSQKQQQQAQQVQQAPVVSSSSISSSPPAPAAVVPTKPPRPPQPPKPVVSAAATGSVTPATSTTSTSSGMSMSADDLARLKLEEEIRQMEAAIAAQQALKQKQKQIATTASAASAAPIPSSSMSASTHSAALSAHNSSTHSATSTVPPLALTPAEQAIVTQYRQMTKLGIPEPAIRHKMQTDNVVDPKIVEAVFATQELPLTQKRIVVKKRLVRKKRVVPAGAGSGSASASQSSSSTLLSPAQEAVADQYRKMVQLGIPEPAIRHKMNNDNVTDSKVIEAVFAATPTTQQQSTPYRKVPASSPPAPPAPPAAPAASAPTLSAAEEAVAEQYRKMVKMGIPEAAVRHRMNRDNKVTPKIINAVFAGVTQQHSTPSTAVRRTAPPPPLARSAPTQPTAPAVPAITLSDADEAIAGKYRKMVKMGIPSEAVRHQMNKENVDQKIVKAVLASSSSAPTSSAAAALRAPAPRPAPAPPRQAAAPKITLSASQEEIAAPYRKMAKMGIPEPAIRHQMEKDGVDDKTIIDAVCGPPEPVAPAAPRPPRATPPKATTSAAAPASAPADDPMAFLSSLAQAVQDRDERLEENGGELFMKEHEPEVAAKAITPQLSTSMAELVSKGARDREARLAAGGEKKMTVIKEKEEYKKTFNEIVMEAASMGRLTRLNEKVIESVAVEKTREEEWRSNGLLAIQWRSNHMAVIKEAARLGAETKMKEKVVSNAEEPDEDYDDDMEWDAENSCYTTKMSEKRKELVKLNTTVGTGHLKVDKLIGTHKEEAEGGESLLVKPMVAYSNVHDIKLPRVRPPKIDPLQKLSKAQKEIMEQQQKAVAAAAAANGDDTDAPPPRPTFRPLIDISKDVAEKAWERRTRLDRPNSLPRVKAKCECPYCFDPSPYQTYAYRELDRMEKEEGHVRPDPEKDKELEKERKRQERRAARDARSTRVTNRSAPAAVPVKRTPPPAIIVEEEWVEEEVVEENEVISLSDMPVENDATNGPLVDRIPTIPPVSSRPSRANRSGTAGGRAVSNSGTPPTGTATGGSMGTTPPSQGRVSGDGSVRKQRPPSARREARAAATAPVGANNSSVAQAQEQPPAVEPEGRRGRRAGERGQRQRASVDRTVSEEQAPASAAATRTKTRTTTTASRPGLTESKQTSRRQMGRIRTALNPFRRKKQVHC